jgi:sigma-B regulation protein RsbU (phosphoserine phosphatase)
MQILIADDEAVSRRLLEFNLSRWGYEAISVPDGDAAWARLTADDAPRIAIVDWIMPGIDGLDLCRRIRSREAPYTYLIMLTVRGDRDSVKAGFDAGADDFLSKPYDPMELHSRLRVGERILGLETAVKTLEGLLSICMHCKKIKHTHDSWEQIESYIERHSDARFSHSLCEDCLEEHYPA